MNLWKSESAIVVMKLGNAGGAKGWQIGRAYKEKQCLYTAKTEKHG